MSTNVRCSFDSLDRTIYNFLRIHLVACKVMIDLRKQTNYSRLLLVRAVSCLLVLGITYAATFGSIHSHANGLSRPSAREATSATAEPNLSSEPASGSQTLHHDCLICVLQQQLVNGLICKLPSLRMPQAIQLVQVPKSVAPYFSITNTPQRDRAPPATLI